MNDVSKSQNMQLVAYSPTQMLLYDASNSQLFYLYTKSTGQLTLLSSSDAATFYKNAPNQSSGITSWGHTPTEGSHLGNNSIN